MAAKAIGVREWYADVPRKTHVPTTAGILSIVVFLLGFGYWSNTALIAGAIITSGAFVTTGQNKIIQHLEGGVIREILIHEGDIVEQGQSLIQLDETGPKAELDRFLLRHMRSEAMESRLVAEIRDEPQVTFPRDLMARRNEPDVQSMISSQQLTFDAWRKNLESDVAALQDSISAIKERISAAQTQKAAVERQIQLIGEELANKSALLPAGLVRKPEILALQRAQAALNGEVGKLEGEMGEAKEQIAKTKQQIIGMRTAAIKDAVEQLHQTRAELTDLRERRTTPTLLGKVAYVSADALPDDLQTVQGREVYVVRVQLDEEQPPAMQNFKPKPGMPAEVYIKTAERTFFEYLMQPIRDSMSRAFRES
jgi:HlyD family type I secretion membrane fusion protein